MRWWLKKQFLRIKLYAYENYQQEAESLVIWYAVAFAFGAAFYFVSPQELSVFAITALFEAVLVLLYLTRKKEAQFKILTYIAVFMLGLCVAKADALYKSEKIEKEVSEISYLHGKIKNMDYNANNRLRLLLEEADNYEKGLKGLFSVTVNKPNEELNLGDCVELVAKFPKKWSENPLGNYNFNRASFYKGLSASGYSIGPVFKTECQNKAETSSQLVDTAREKVKQAADLVSPQTAAIIKAITVGDKSAIDKTLAQNYRTAGLAHFFAISGMHMSIIALLVFFLVRSLFFMAGEGRYDLRKPAAIAAFLFTGAYFLISGQSVSCVRAFIMTTLVLFAVLLNRRPISLRLWAFALLVVVSVTPHAVVMPGFLMSFAAVLGLVSFYEAYAAPLNRFFDRPGLMAKLAAYLSGIIVADFVASIMTLPYSMYYFNQISVYTSLGNLLAGPLIAFGIMPSLLLFLISLPFGLEAYAIIPLDKTISALNAITAYVSTLPGADAGEGAGLIPDGGIFLITLGLLWLSIWRAKWRRLGLIMILFGILTIFIAPKPDFVFDNQRTTFAYKNNSENLTASCWHKNKFLEKMWTGGNIKGKCEHQTSNGLACSKDSCTYKSRIEFAKGYVKLDGQKLIEPHGGYISLKHGVFYKRPSTSRLWDK